MPYFGQFSSNISVLVIPVFVLRLLIYIVGLYVLGFAL